MGRFRQYPIQYTMLASAIGMLGGCAATQTALEHRTLETKTALSKTVFLDPVSKSQRTVFLVVKNTSTEAIDIAPSLSEALRARGYRVVKNPTDAHYLLQANVRQVGKMSVAASQNALGQGFGSALAGGVTGAALGAFSGNTTATLASGVAGGVLGLAADSLVKDVNFTMITDVQISERASQGVKVHEQFNSQLANGSTSSTQQTSNRSSDFTRYRTRIVSNADKVNLSFATARPALEQGLVKTLAGIF